MIPYSVQKIHGWTFDDFPGVMGIVDTSFLQVCKKKVGQGQYYSGKHKRHGVKIQTINACNGVVMEVSQLIPASVHDITIFRRSGAVALFQQTRWVNRRCEHVGHEGLFDGGYQGLAREMAAIIPARRRPNKDLTEEESEHNRRIAHRRIVIENYYARLKGYWGVLSGRYRGDLSDYNTVVRLCVALTNILVMRYPLRRDERFTDEADVLGEVDAETAAGSGWAEANEIFDIGTDGTAIQGDELQHQPPHPDDEDILRDVLNPSATEDEEGDGHAMRSESYHFEHAARLYRGSRHASRHPQPIPAPETDEENAPLARPRRPRAQRRRAAPADQENDRDFEPPRSRRRVVRRQLQ